MTDSDPTSPDDRHDIDLDFYEQLDDHVDSAGGCMELAEALSESRGE